MSLHIGEPQIIFLAIQFAGMGVSLANYGKPRTGNVGFIDLIVAPAIVLGLLIWGGFFGGLS